MTKFSFTLEGRALAAAIKPLLAVIERPNRIPILSNVYMDFVGAMLRIKSTNLDMTMETYADVIGSSGSPNLTVEAHRLHALARLAGSAPVTICSADDPTYVVIDVADGDVVYKLPSLPVGDWADSDTEFDSGVVVDTFTNGHLSALLGKVSPFMSTEETRYYLNGVYWEMTADGCRFVATDGRRMAVNHYSKEVGRHGDFHVIIPYRAIGIVEQFFKGRDVRVEVDTLVDDRGKKQPARLVIFRSHHLALYTKFVDGKYPEWRRIIPSTDVIKQHLFKFDADRLREAIARCNIVAVNGHRAITLSPGKDGVEASVNVGGYGSVMSKTYADWPESAKDIDRLGYNLRYLLDMLGKHRGEFNMLVQGGDLPCQIDNGDEDLIRLIMPMRV